MISSSESKSWGEYRKAQKSSERKESALGWGFLMPYALHFLLFSLVPLGLGFFFSFCKYNPYDAGSIEFIGFQNHILVFQDNIYAGYFWNSLVKTILFAIVAVPCLIIIPLGLAYLINLQPPGYKIFRAIIYVPSVVSISIVGILFSSIFSSSGDGLFNGIFQTQINFLNDPDNEILRWVVILIASIWGGTGANFVIFLAALKNVPKSLYEANEIDGGGRWQAFLKVTLPNISGSLGLCLFSTLIGYLGLYGQAYVLRGSLYAGTYDSPMMFIQGMLNDVNKVELTGLITAFSVVFGLVIMIFTGFQSVAMKKRKGGNKNERRFNDHFTKEQI